MALDKKVYGALIKKIKNIQTGNVKVKKNADGGFSIYANKGEATETKAEFTKDELKGLGIKSVEIKDVIVNSNTEKHLIVTLTDNTEIDAGKLPSGGGSGTTDYADLTNKPSINGVELSGNKSLTDLGITEYDDTQVKADISTNTTNIATNKQDINDLKNDNTTNKSDITDLKTDKQDKTDNTLNTTDKTVTGAINEVNGNLLGTVGFSADYKNIILNRKSGLNPYIIPIASIIHNAKLTELNDIDSTNIGDGKTLIYDSATQKHKYADSVGTDELVKMEASTDAKYLTDLIDKNTVVNDNGVLKVKKLDGQEVTITEINYLKGLTMNVMDLVNTFSNGGVKILNTPVATHTDLLTLDRSTFIDGISYIVYVLKDETHSGAKTTYLCDKTSETFFGNADEHRDFATDPINLATEVTGKLGTSHIDVDELWKLLTINDTYKTLTTKDEPFGTHGAKALYDELVTDIGKKANATDVTTHVSNTDIHVTSVERTKWDKVTDKVDKTDIITTIDNTVTDEQIASARAVLRSKSAIRMDESVNPENYEVGAWFAEGHDSILLSTSYGHPCSEWHIGYVVTGYEVSDSEGYKIILAIAMSGNCYIKVQRWNTWTSWRKIYSTSINDIPSTNITEFESPEIVSGKVTYEVKNGICYISGHNLKSGTINRGIILKNLPKTTAIITSPIINDQNGETVGFAFIDEGDTVLNAHYFKDSFGYFSLSYPVAEN